MLRSRVLILAQRATIARSCSSKSEQINEPQKPSNFSEALERLQSALDETKKVKTPNKSFATLLRESNFMKLGDPCGKIVNGKIFRVVNDDLYIDFGSKLYAVCKKPASDSEDYVLGQFVKIRLHDLEISSRFLGTEQDLSLLEADATLIGLSRDPTARQDLK